MKKGVENEIKLNQLLQNWIDMKSQHTIGNYFTI